MFSPRLVAKTYTQTLPAFGTLPSPAYCAASLSIRAALLEGRASVAQHSFATTMNKAEMR